MALLLIHCLLLLPLFVGSLVFGPCFVMQYLVSFFSFASLLSRKRERVALPFHYLPDAL